MGRVVTPPILPLLLFPTTKREPRQLHADDIAAEDVEFAIQSAADSLRLVTVTSYDSAKVGTGRPIIAVLPNAV